MKPQVNVSNNQVSITSEAHEFTLDIPEWVDIDVLITGLYAYRTARAPFRIMPDETPDANPTPETPQTPPTSAKKDVTR